MREVVCQVLSVRFFRVFLHRLVVEVQVVIEVELRAIVDVRDAVFELQILHCILNHGLPRESLKQKQTPDKRTSAKKKKILVHLIQLHPSSSIISPSYGAAQIEVVGDLRGEQREGVVLGLTEVHSVVVDLRQLLLQSVLATL